MKTPRNPPTNARARARKKPGPKPAVPITPALVDAIFGDYIDGKTVLEACEARKLRRRRFYEHLAANADLRVRYEALLAAHIDARVERMRKVAATEKDVNRARVLIDVEKWVASRLDPSRYGDRQKIEHGGDVTFRSTAEVDEALLKVLVPIVGEAEARAFLERIGRGAS